MAIDVIIPNYNGFHLIKQNLNKVVTALDLPGIDTTIIIVDDHSQIHEFEELEKFIAVYNREHKVQVKLLRNRKNYGFSTTVDNGVNASNAELVMLLNSDAVPHKDFLKPLLDDFKNDDKLFGVGCMDESIEEGGVVLRGRGEGNFRRGFLIHHKADVDAGTHTLWISGGSSLVRKSYFDKIGGFDTIYNPFYWEDIDLSYRAQKAGFIVKFDKRSKVSHIHEEGAIKKHFKRSYIKKIAYRNQFIFVWKNITDKTLLLEHILWLPYYFLLALKNRDQEFYFGFILALTKLPDIIAKRKKQKKLFILKDKDILS